MSITHIGAAGTTLDDMGAQATTEVSRHRVRQHAGHAAGDVFEKLLDSMSQTTLPTTNAGAARALPGAAAQAPPATSK
ncbi:MAG: hypothetical protein ABUS56_06145 [Acidobacteriota bacterium]